MQSLSRNIATLMGLGFIGFAPGTWGSLATLPLFAVMFHAAGLLGTLIALPLILSLGWWATQSYTQLHKNHDPSEVIIDEVAGQWIALLPLAVG
ncbi:MAG: phosphatidylglycerophosphatase A, partial [Rhodobacteraceae bacterium]|nr:phosphatidylglycerophosphatase A [Paracoccaceae bacterium]